MKKLFIALLLVLLVPSLSLAVDFAPVKLQLTAPETVQYDFDGSEMTIPLTVTGTPARTWFFVFTKDKAEDIIEVRNGNLGWHWVNKIDTCVYMSQQMDFAPGSNEVMWNGQDSDGGMVPPGDYTYYMWAFDYETSFAAQQATPRIAGFNWPTWKACSGHVQEKDEQGMPLEHPFLMDYDIRSGNDNNYVYKWTMGQDPLNPDLSESTELLMDDAWRDAGTGGPFQPNPTDHSIYYLAETGPDTHGIRHRQFTWVPNDMAEFEPEPLYQSNECHDIDGFAPGVTSDGNYLYWEKCWTLTSEPCTMDYIMDFDGEIIASWQKDLWIFLEEHLQWGGALNLGSTQKSQRDGYIFQGTWYCVQGMLDPLRYLENENYPDPELWLNQVGDGVLDRGFEPDSPTPNANNTEGPPHITTHYSDANYFSSCGFSGMGAVSMGLLAPDGTGVGYIPFAGETGDGYRETFFIDNGSAYDGMYAHCRGLFGTDDDIGRGGVSYLGQDSIKGVISPVVVVADEAPSAFAVEQNSPNPANPTTSISFTLPDAGNVTVEIFNMAGQKVDTLVNDFMDSGRHSVVWNGSNVSTGIYFYSVTSGEFTKTMKMTLLK